MNSRPDRAEVEAGISVKSCYNDPSERCCGLDWGHNGGVRESGGDSGYIQKQNQQNLLTTCEVKEGRESRITLRCAP